MIQNLRVVTWNANGLTERRQELEIFLETEKIDIALVSETRFTSKSHITFNKYKIYTTNHPSGNSHGGSAVIIKNNIKHYSMEEYRTEKIQATTIVVLEKHIETVFSAVYCPPRHTITVQDYKDYFSTLGIRFISAGDWNAKHLHWGSRLTTTRGRQLHMVTQDMKLDYWSGGEPTYWPTDKDRIPDLLDFFITKNMDGNYITIESCTDLTSDHTPVILNVNSTIQLVEPPLKIYNTKTTNWEKYRDIIESEINLKAKIDTNEAIENEIEKLNMLIHRAACLATTKRKGQPPKNNSYPKEIKEKIKTRRQLRKVWQNTGYPNDKTAFNKFSDELKKLINNEENDKIQNMLSNLDPTVDTNYSLWKVTKNMKRPKTHIPAVNNNKGGWARSDQEKATTFAEHLSNVFNPHPESCHKHTEEVINYLESPNQMCSPLRSTSPKEIFQEIKKLKEGKAPGYDYIDATLLKKLPYKAVMKLVHIFNASLRFEFFPGQWKIAQIIMIPKPGKPLEQPNSYRPISLLPVIGKLFERILLNRMKVHLNTILPQHQFGFRESHGTIEQVHRIIDTIGRCLENKLYCSAVFLDISQAFDKVWHEGLIYKIKKTLPHCFLQILKSYLDKRSFQVKCNDDSSELYEIKSGVPQGSILGPILYLIFTADIPTDDQTITATYADDTALLSTDNDPVTASHTLQSHLNKVESWLKQWRIKANETKSAHVTFTLRRGTCPPIKLNDKEIPQTDNAKYLGMNLDRRLTWQKHIWAKRKQLDTKLRSLHWLIGRSSQLNTTSKILVYKAILKPVWTYGIQLWGTASRSNIDILERFQSKVLRMIFRIPQCISNKYMYLDLGINTVREEIVQASQKYQKKLATHANELAQTLSGEGGLHYSRLKRQGVPSLAQRFVN